MKTKLDKLLQALNGTKAWHLFLLFVIPYTFLVYVVQEYIYYDPIFFTGGNENSIGTYRRVYKIIYLLLPFLFYLKFKLLEVFIQLLVGSKNFITSDKKALFKLLVAASFVFFIPFVVKIIWFLGFTTSYTMEQADTFRFLSLYQFLADVDGFEGLSFLLKFTNLFQILYFLLVSYGIAQYTTKSFGQSAAIFFLIYVLPNLAYAVLIYVLKSKAF
jgi:hypothetical protein